MENVITLDKLIGLLFLFLYPPPLYFVFENSENKRNDLARPVMGTIFLVYKYVNTSWKSLLKLVDTEYLNAPYECNK